MKKLIILFFVIFIIRFFYADDIKVIRRLSDNEDFKYIHLVEKSGLKGFRFSCENNQTFYFLTDKHTYNKTIDNYQINHKWHTEVKSISAYRVIETIWVLTVYNIINDNVEFTFNITFGDLSMIHHKQLIFKREELL